MIVNNIVFMIGYVATVSSVSDIWGKPCGWFAWGLGMVAMAFFLQLQDNRKR